VADTSRMKPDFAVYLDGTKLQGEEAAAIIGIRVFQTRFGASAFEIVVSDQDLTWQGKPTFTECKEVKIELGVPGKLKKVFDGEVTAWRTELERSGPTVLVVRGLDRVAPHDAGAQDQDLQGFHAARLRLEDRWRLRLHRQRPRAARPTR